MYQCYSHDLAPSDHEQAQHSVWIWIHAGRSEAHAMAIGPPVCNAAATTVQTKNTIEAHGQTGKDKHKHSLTEELRLVAYVSKAMLSPSKSKQKPGYSVYNLGDFWNHNSFIMKCLKPSDIAIKPCDIRCHVRSTFCILTNIIKGLSLNYVTYKNVLMIFVMGRFAYQDEDTRMSQL